MAKITDVTSKFIRSVFSREKQKSELAISNKKLIIPAYGGFLGSEIDVGSTGGISESLGLERRYLYRYADYESMDEYGDIACLAGDSLIFMLDKGWFSISKLAEKKESFYVLAYDKDRRSLVPAFCEGARKTGQSGHGKPMVNVVLDNGVSICCTADHLFLTKDGRWIEAGKLNTGERLTSGIVRVQYTSSCGQNHRVLRVEKLDTSEDVYDLTVPVYHNFVCNEVVVHNSALDIYADDVSCVDTETGHSVWIKTNDTRVKEELEDLFWKRLNIEEKIWPISRGLCKYGNDFEEIVISDSGVVDLRYMPPATVQRIESDKADLLGFVQSYDGNFAVTPEQFEKMKIETGAELNPSNDMAVYTDWRVVHMRLLAKHRELMYGVSVIDPARWIWKRLLLLEDAVLVYKLCLRGDSKIWTANGYKAIRDIEEGEEVFSYTTADKLKKTRVIYKKHNGKDLLYRIRSSHRELFANATHPILVETILPDGRRLDYVEVRNLKPFVHRLVTPWREDYLCSNEKYDEFLSFIEGNRISSSIFKCSSDVRKAFVDWLVSADKPDLYKISVIDNHVFWKSRSKELSEDVYELIMQLGYEVDFLFDNDLYVFSWKYDCQPMTEYVESVEEFEVDDIWDIGVEADEHNFVANGIVVHNTRSPSRYAFYVDVGKLPKQEAEKALQEVIQRLKKKKFINPRNGKIDLKFNPLPVADDSLIPLLDGRTITISEMASEFESGKKHWVYSINPETGNLAPGEVEWVGKTRENEAAVKLTFDDGGWVKMAVDHPVMKRDRSYCLAKDLIVGDKVMPFWRKISEHGYEIVYDPGDQIYKRSSGVDSNLSDLVFLKSEESFYRINHLGHAIVKIETVNPCDHYCMTVKDWHNFALVAKDGGKVPGWSSGVFVKNSFDEDFFLATRDGKETTRVESLMGPSYQQVEDVEYFLNKLYAALKVPKAYLGYDQNLPSKATLSAEDVRFGRSVLRIQRELRNGLKKVASVDLAARNIDPAAVDFEIDMSVPSAIFELGQMEVRRARADLAALMERHVSLNWILGNVYGFSDDEIAKIAKQKKDEQKMSMSMGGGAGGGGFESKMVRSPSGSLVERGNITERELFAGKREDEKRMLDVVMKVLKDPNNPIGRQLKETGMLLREILHSMKAG